jgi:hypothetical protein
VKKWLIDHNTDSGAFSAESKQPISPYSEQKRPLSSTSCTVSVSGSDQSLQSRLNNPSADWKTKPVETWSSDHDVYAFVCSVGPGSVWREYAQVLKKARVDGASLQCYDTYQELMEDYPAMTRIHAKTLLRNFAAVVAAE